jgi:hypothetical protein
MLIEISKIHRNEIADFTRKESKHRCVRVDESTLVYQSYREGCYIDECRHTCTYVYAYE